MVIELCVWSICKRIVRSVVRWFLLCVLLSLRSVSVATGYWWQPFGRLQFPWYRAQPNDDGLATISRSIFTIVFRLVRLLLSMLSMMVCVCVVPFDRFELQIGMDLVRISYFIGFDCCPSNAVYPNCENRILRFFSSQFIFIMCTSIRSIDVLLLLHQRQYEHSTLHSSCTRRVRAWTICCGRGNRTRIMRQNSV